MLPALVPGEEERMKNAIRILAAGAVLMALTAGGAESQTYRWDVGVNGGHSWYSWMLDSEQANFDGDVRFRQGWLAGAQLGFWATPRIGVRANMTYTDRPLVGAGMGGERQNLIEHVNLWSGSADLMIRAAEPNQSWFGPEWLPYLALGLGGKWHNPAGQNTVAGTNPDLVDGTVFQPFTAGGAAGPWLFLDEGPVLMGLVGLGTDVRLSPNFALRIELNDRIYRPDLYTAQPTETPNQFTRGERVARTVHEVGVQLGAHLLFGLQPPPPVLAPPAPPPPPPPPPPAPPPPPPAPVEESVMVCVVDPAAPGGLRMQPAIYRFEQRDTVVVQAGERIPLRQAIGEVPVVRDAGWYIRGEPFVMMAGTQRMEFVTYQTPRQIEADRLTYLGRFNGMPVYGDRDQVQRISDDLARIHATAAGDDLNVILRDNRNIRDAVADLEVLYVPMQPTGCVFQGVIRTEDIRKGKDS
jgi:hypothetical protein